MSDTPRTSSMLELILETHGVLNGRTAPHQLVILCRELERELNAANERIKRLEELYEDQVEIARNWKGAAYSIADDMLKAKEAKP